MGFDSFTCKTNRLLDLFLLCFILLWLLLKPAYAHFSLHLLSYLLALSKHPDSNYLKKCADILLLCLSHACNTSIYLPTRLPVGTLHVHSLRMTLDHKARQTHCKSYLGIIPHIFQLWLWRDVCFLVCIIKM